MPDVPTGIDLESLSRWAASALPALTPPFTADVIVGGQSNITAHVRDAAGRELVVRRPPLHGVLPTAHDMGREHRIIAALGPTPVPVPEALAYCDDPEVIGAPFYVMSYVEGTVLHDDDTAVGELDLAARAHSGESLVDALVALHAVDVDAVGLGDLARRDELVARQLKRWHAQFEASKTRELPAVDRVHELLSAQIPPQTESTVVHGDFRLGNCIVDHGGDVVAVLDWEICTLGDPRADVGYVLATWAEPGDPLRADDHNPTLAPGFTTRDVLLARYAERSGRDVSEIQYFVAFSFWRLACILEGVLSRLLSGARGEDDVDLDYFRRRVESCAQLAEEYARGL
ncbi:MAG TPA: phosphotransferase family protein [Acidimicrobiia bacterium]